MGILSDFWQGIPKEVKLLLIIAIFLYAGSTILQGVVFGWNLVGVNAINAVNGCWTTAPTACIPEQKGIFIFGINFADYWTITVLMILLPIAFFAIKWYTFIFGRVHQG